MVREMSTQSLDFPNYDSEFTYRPMPVLVPISLAFVFLSLLAGLSDMLLVVPLVGVVLAFLGYYQIARSSGELSGGVLALVSLVLMLLMFMGFGGMHLHSYFTELPDGFQRISFNNDISQKGFGVQDNQLMIHPDVVKLADQKVYLKGYMYPFRNTRDLQTFVLCKDSGECCFGGQPKPTDMILINMNGGKTVNYLDKRLVGVAGTLRIEPKFDESGLNPIYQLDCDFFAPAKTWY
jgi:hypothetical protein